jgi:hypothetical protein
MHTSARRNGIKESMVLNGRHDTITVQNNRGMGSNKHQIELKIFSIEFHRVSYKYPILQFYKKMKTVPAFCVVHC